MGVPPSSAVHFWWPSFQSFSAYNLRSSKPPTSCPAAEFSLPWAPGLGRAPLVNYSFGTCQQRKVFPHSCPPSLLGNKFLPFRGEPNRGPGCYIAEDRYGLAYNLSKVPTSIKGYAFGARTAVRFKPINKVRNEQKHKHNFAPFNSLLPRFRTYSKDSCYPGPTTYNPEIKPPKKVTWPMKFGSPDWAQVPCLQKRTLRAELPTDKDFRKHRNRVAYLSLYYN
uniref:Protein pitchfork n=1 Tax=Phocoena sinus TaxID=42100 RepID=A0A8C9CQ54_PHOSS